VSFSELPVVLWDVIAVALEDVEDVSSFVLEDVEVSSFVLEEVEDMVVVVAAAFVEVFGSLP